MTRRGREGRGGTPPVACALPAGERAARRDALLPGLVARARERRFVEGGERWRFDPESGLLAELAAVIDQERRCCPFLRFEVVVEPDGGPIWLEATGPEETAAFLESLLSSP